MTQSTAFDGDNRSRKRKALLAGGLVLGLGATATLAMWSDDVWVTSAFNVAAISIEGSVDALVVPTNWQPYGTPESAAPMTFTVAPTAMRPGDTVWAPLSLRLAEGSTGSAAIALPEGGAPQLPPGASAADTAFFQSLRVTFYQGLTPNLCSGLLGGAGVPVSGYTNVPLDTDGTGPLFTLTGPLTPYNLCMKIEFPSAASAAAANGATGPLTWNFRATAIG